MPSKSWYDHNASERVARDSYLKCPDCGVSSRTWRGAIHKYRCSRCVADVVGVTARPADPRPRWERVAACPPGCDADVDAKGRPILPMPTRRKEAS